MKQHDLSFLFEFLENEKMGLSRRQQEQISMYYETLLGRSRTMNLVSKGDAGHLVARHFASGFCFVKHLRGEGLVGTEKLIDLGTGAGFPGMMISIYFSDMDVVLLDSSRKKTLFLQHIVKKTGLKARVVWGRIEHLHKEFDGSFDVLTARAVSSLDNLVSWGFPVLKPGGYVFTVKGSDYENELTRFAELYGEIRPFRIDRKWEQHFPYLSGKLFIKVEKGHDQRKFV